MITIMPAGRLGNHLFQFAFGLSVSKNLKTDFIFNTSEIETLFEMKRYNNPVRRKLRTLRYMFSLKFNDYITLDLSQEVDPAEIMSRVNNNNILFGYFQSYLYFEKYSTQVKKALQIKQEYVKEFRSQYSELFNKPVVCLAIRRTDYITWHVREIDENTPELSFDYFKGVLKLIPELEQKNLIIHF